MRISPAESKVMEALWRHDAMTMDDLVDEVGGSESWGKATVKTLVNRLLNKGALASVRIEGRQRYQAVLRRDAYVQSESQGLLDRLFGGQLAPLVSHFAEHKALSAADIARLKALIAEMDDGD
jgi:predicted transcriptional regulator